MVLSGLGSVNDLSFARSLGRRGVPVVMLAGADLLGTYTRFARVLRIEGEEEWRDVLDRVADACAGRPVLFPTCDAHCAWLAGRPELASRFQALLTPPDVTTQLLDKRAQHELATSLGIPVPATFAPADRTELEAVAAQLAYPCLLKPRVGGGVRARGAAKVAVVASRDALLEEYPVRTAGGRTWLVQELIPGDDDALVGYLGLWDGDELAWVGKRKLRQFPPGYGDGSLQVTEHVPDIVEPSRRLLAAVGFRGFAGIEWKRDPRDGAYRLIEINPRTVSGNELAVRAGVDFPWLAYRYLTAGEMPSASFQPGVKYVNEEWDLQAFCALRRQARLTTWQWLRSLRGAKARAIAAWDDPRPLLVGLWRSVTRSFQATSVEHPDQAQGTEEAAAEGEENGGPCVGSKRAAQLGRE